MTPTADWFRELLWAQCWQVTIVILAVGLLTTVCCRRRPHLAYILWLAVLLKCLTPPLWSSPTGIFSWAQQEPSRVTRADASPLPTVNSTASQPLAHNDDARSQFVHGDAPLPIDATPVPSRRPTANAVSAPAIEPAMNTSRRSSAILAVWILGVTLYFIVVAVAVGRCLRAIRRHEASAAETRDVAALMQQLSQRLGLRSSVHVALVNQSIGPMTYGFLRPTIVMPLAVTQSRSCVELEPLLAHELIHIRRGDAFIGLMQTFVQGLFWFHPLVWWANRRMTAERERCCDEEVVTALNYKTGEYARSLLGVIELKQQSLWPATLPGIRPYEITKRRLEHLMQNSQRFRKRTPPAYWLVLVLAALLLTPGAGLTQATEEEQSSGLTQATQEKQPRRLTQATGAEQPSKPAAQVSNSIRVSHLISPDGQRIAYPQIAVGPNGEQRVRIIVGNVDGTDRRALPIEGDNVDEVQWYGNDQIAYVKKHGQDGYFLMDLNGKPAPHLLMPRGCDAFHHQCLSPDGQWIAFCGNVPSTNTYFNKLPGDNFDSGLFVANLKQQTVKRLLSETVANMPAWSADSKRLAAGIGAYVREYPLVIIDVESGKVERPNVQGVGIAWSPNHKSLAMTTDIVRGGSWRAGVPLDGALAVWDIATSQRKIVSPAGSNISVKEPYSWVYRGSHGPVWSPDGEWIAYQQTENAKKKGAEDERREEIWIVRRDGSDSRKVLNHGVAELAWTKDGKRLLFVADGRFGSIDREIDATALGPTPAAPAGAFTVQGRVTDGDGKPLENVEIRVSRGIGTLFSSDPMKTNSDGWYEIHFGPGMHSENANMQYACVFADKPGFFEKNLCRKGNLAMANFKPKDYRDGDWGVAGIVYPGNPYRVDFTMLPAASVSLQLMNTRGEPLADYQIYLSGEKLYPASSVLAGGRSNADGRLTIDTVPTHTCYFTVSARKIEYRTDPISFNRAEPWKIRLVYDDLAGTLVAKPD